MENTTANLTIHHNWFRETEQRNPSTDNVAHAHLYNNYIQDDPGTDITSSYGNYARGRTRMVLENSYFQGVNNPVIKDDTARLVQRGNVFARTSGRNESGGAAFDPKAYDNYRLDQASNVPAILKSGAGTRGSIGTTVSAGSPAAAAQSTLTVAKDGSGRYKSVQKAVDAVPAGNTSRVVIRIAPGTYRETVKVPADKPHHHRRRRGRPELLPRPPLARRRRREPRPADHHPRQRPRRGRQGRSLDGHGRLLLEERPFRRVPQ